MHPSERKAERELYGVSRRKRGNKAREKEKEKVEGRRSRDLASASPLSDPRADPFQVPIINSIRQMHASIRSEYELSVLCTANTFS